MKIKEQLKCELARRDFFEFCKILHKDFYTDDKEYLKKMCYSMQEFFSNDDEFMIVNLPP